MKIRNFEIKGGSPLDAIFSIDVPGLPPLSWNVTRISAAVAEGCFGEPERLPMSILPPMGDAERANIDWEKVREIGADPARLHRPVIGVIFSDGDIRRRVFVDGNHRICARQAARLPFFEAFVVPDDVESHFRVTITEV